MSLTGKPTQVEPRTGIDGARVLGGPDFDPLLLYVADVNLAIGMRHFAAALARYPEAERARRLQRRLHAG